MRIYHFILLIGILIANNCFSQNAIFLHHSTGGGVYYEGKVEEWITNYNSMHSTNYSITERSYPDSPYPWENYPYDFWNLWVNMACNNAESGIECLESITQKYDVIIFKHCFPGASINVDNGNADITSSDKTLANYKLQYKALLEKMDNFPATKFIVWTLAPLHRNATNASDAARAREFVDWVKNSWLTEDGKPHANVYIYDFFGIVAESEANPANGQLNCLKYNYERDHNGSDSHPNETANKAAGPLFAQCVVEAIENKPTVHVNSIEIIGENHKIETLGGSFHLSVKVLPEDAEDKNITWTIVSGEAYVTLSADGLLTALGNGFVEVKATSADNPNATATYTVEITNQITSVKNPGGKELKIKFDSNLKTYLIEFNELPANARIEIYDILGKKVLSDKPKTTTYIIPCLSKGIYLLNVHWDSRECKQKIVY